MFIEFFNHINLNSIKNLVKENRVLFFFFQLQKTAFCRKDSE